MKFLIFIFLLFPFAAHGIVVTTLIDEDDGTLGGATGVSLREAVKYSMSGDPITFAATLSGQTLRLTRGYLPISKSTSIDASALPEGLTLSADRTGDGKSPDDTYVILLSSGDLYLFSLTLTGSNCGESCGCITVRPSSRYSLFLHECTMTRNTGYHASAIYCSGSGNETQSSNTITILNSTISRNFAVKEGSVSVSGSNLYIQNSTFGGNEGSAISYWIRNTESTLSISNSTIVTSKSSKNGSVGLSIGYTILPVTIFIDNTIFDGGNPPTIYNPSPFATISGNSNIFSGSALLAPLGDYGGPTWTMPPLPGSPAINAGGPNNVRTDQRGFLRHRTQDIGAAEFQGTVDLKRFWNLDFDGDGSPYGAEQALGSDCLAADPTNPCNLTPPTFEASGRAEFSFGLASLPAMGTHWIVQRSPDLSPGSFAEIYRTDQTTDAVAQGVSFIRTATSVTITDGKPLPSAAFYRFEAVLEPK